MPLGDVELGPDACTQPRILSPSKAELTTDRAGFEARQDGKEFPSSSSIPATNIHVLPMYAFGDKALDRHLHNMGTIGRAENNAICNERNGTVAHRQGTARLWLSDSREFVSDAIALSIVKGAESACHALAVVFRQAVRPQQAALCGSCRITLHGALMLPNLVPWLIIRSLTGQGHTRHITLPLRWVQSQAFKAMITFDGYHNRLLAMMSKGTIALAIRIGICLDLWYASTPPEQVLYPRHCLTPWT